MPETNLDEFVEGMGDELSEDQHRALRAITKGDTGAVAIPDEVTDALTAEQKDRLNHLEGVIKKNFRGFVEVGLALKAIRDERLYIASHLTFEQYCRDKFELSRKVSYDKINAAEVVDLLSSTQEDSDSAVDVEFVTNCDIDAAPETEIQPLESHARKLAELPPEDRPDAWKRACQRGIERHGRVTAKTVAEVVAEALGKRTEEAIATAKKCTNVSKKTNREIEFVDPAFTKALNTFLEEISAARIRNWYGAPKTSVLKALRVVLQAIEAE